MSRWSEEPIVFDCAEDRLVGILHRAVGPGARLGVLVVIGGPQYRVGSHRQFVLMARDLAAAGHPVLRFDYRGMGDSDGEPRTFEFIEDDLRAAIAAFERAVPELRGIVMWGLCDAASAIMMNATPELVRGKVAVNPWVRTEASEARAYVRHYYLQRVLQKDFWRKLGGGSLDVRAAIGQFVEALRRTATPSGKVAGAPDSYIDRMLTGIRVFRGATLVLLSGRDLTAREFEALGEDDAEWTEALRAPAVQSVKLKEADHTFSERRLLDVGTHATLRWIRELEGSSV